MAARDRVLVLGLLAVAVLAWLTIAVVMNVTYPDDQGLRVGVGAGLGLAVALTATPLAWLAAFGRRGRLARAGDWVRATRRGALLGALIALLAVLQLTGTTSLPIVAFAIVLVIFVELTLSYRR